MAKSTKIFLGVFVVFVIIFLYVHQFFVFVVVDGHSMEPTFKNRSVLWFNRVNDKLELGDVVCFSLENHMYIKRITGAPGDYYLINDTSKLHPYDEINESYMLFDPKVMKNHPMSSSLVPSLKVKVIPKGYYFVEGDNIKTSEDSKMFGLISQDQVLGEQIGGM